MRKFLILFLVCFLLFPVAAEAQSPWTYSGGGSGYLGGWNDVRGYSGLPGVYCPNCPNVQMNYDGQSIWDLGRGTYQQGYWYTCPECGSTHAYINNYEKGGTELYRLRYSTIEPADAQNPWTGRGSRAWAGRGTNAWRYSGRSWGELGARMNSYGSFYTLYYFPHVLIDYFTSPYAGDWWLYQCQRQSPDGVCRTTD